MNLTQKRTLARKLATVAAQLTKRGRTPQDFDLDAVSAACWGFVGREIERLVKSALETAFFTGQPLTTAHLVAAASRIIPIASSMEIQINDLRSWAKGRALLASDPIEPQPTRTPTQTRTVEL